MKNKSKTVLVLILLVASFLRLYSLGNFGGGFFRDEAALGYNSWSILQTGKDEFGQSHPVIFRSFEVFFMPAYVYLSVPIFAIFGLTDFSARFLSALSGILLVYVAFLIAQKLFKSELAGLASALVVAISPWAIFYSRGAFEGNLALVFFTIGVYNLMRYYDKLQPKTFYLSVLFFVLAMYSYQAPRVVAPLFVGVAIVLQKGWLKNWKLWVIGAVFAAVLYLPILVLTLAPSGNHRALGVSIFSSQGDPLGYNATLGNWQKLYLYPREVLSLYTSYFSPRNLFWDGDYNLQRNVPNFSVFYIWQLPFLFVGLWYLLKSDNKFKKLLLAWIVLAPIPAALTRDPFHTYRSILLYLPLTIILAYGILRCYQMLARNKYVVVSVLAVISTFYVCYFMFSLAKVVPSVYSRNWDFGYKEIIAVVKTEQANLRVVIDDPMTEAYVHFLYFQIIDLKHYQNSAYLLVANGKYYNSSQELRPVKVDRFEFRPVDWPSERGDANTLFIFPADRLYPSEFSGDPNLTVVKTIFAPNGDPAYYLVKNISTTK